MRTAAHAGSKLMSSWLLFLAVSLISTGNIKASTLHASDKAEARGLSVKAASGSIPPGGVTMVDIAAPDEWPDARVTEVRFLGRPFPVYRTGRNHWFAIVGAGLKVKPGRHSITVKWRRGHASDLTVSALYIKRKKYPEEHLKVSRKMVDFPPKILKRVLADQKAVKDACNRVGREKYWQGPFIWPVKSKVLSPFGLRRFFNGQPRSPHSGVDLRARDGVPIKAPNNGRVALARECYLSGNTVVIDHGGGLFTLYAHLSKVKVRPGQMVKKGDVIGLAGSTGRATGPHLHWGVSLMGMRIDPQQFMALSEKHFSNL